MEAYDNKRNKTSFQGKVTYVGPLNMPRRQLQRIKFDLTQDEVIVDALERRQVIHGYADALKPAPRVACYSVNEVLAEKTRALYERQGRARDVYDLVHLNRSFREVINPTTAIAVLRKKFAFKGLPEPTVDVITARVDPDLLRANWKAQLGHQLPYLPPLDSFLVEVRDAIAWWLEPALAAPLPREVPLNHAERTVPRQFFSQPPRRVGRGETFRQAPGRLSYGYSTMDSIRYGARNHLCVRVVYGNVSRVVEPYSLRQAATGNIRLYVWELERDGIPSSGIKAFKVNEIESVFLTTQAFTPRYSVEL